MISFVLPVFDILIFLLFLSSITLLMVKVFHARHARALITAMMLLTLVCEIWFLRFGLSVSERMNGVLLSCYAFSTVIYALVDEFCSVRDRQPARRFVVFLLVGIIFLLTLIIIVGVGR